MDDCWLKELVWHIRLFFDCLNCHLIGIIEEIENCGLEDVCNELELLDGKRRVNFGLAIVIEPQEISILMLVLVEPLEISCALLHWNRDGTRWLVVNWPVSCG